MSHFVAALDLDGVPVAEALLERLAAGLPALGGARRRVRRGAFALAEVHADGRLREGPCVDVAGPEVRHAPIVGGSVRLDALGPAPRPAQRAALRSRWARGPDALDGLRGDLGFVLYDPARGHLVALRDLFGVAPLYHARAGRLLLVASDPAPLLRHPAVDRLPDEAAVADFLLVGENAHPGRTYHRGIHRVRPGHRLDVVGGRVDARRHDALRAAAWDAPAPARRAATLAEELRARLERAVARRLPTQGAALLLSGGLDSAAVAAAAAARLGADAPRRLLACTFGSEPALAEEVAHARAVAQRLGIPHDVEPLEARPLYGASRLDACDPTGPGLDPRDPGGLWARAAAHAPVVLSGFGGDPALRPSPGFLPRLLRRGRPGEALRALALQIRRLGRPPRLGLRSALRARGEDPFAGWPAWLAPPLVRRLDLRARWRTLQAPPTGDPTRRRPEAAASLASPFWPDLFECLAPSVVCPAAVRHPWMDAELLEWLLAVPAVPWCEDKHLLREALRGRIPEATRRRPKAALATYPPQPLPASHAARVAAALRAVEGLDAFVDVEAVVAGLERAVGGEADWVAVAPAVAVGLWLRDLQSGRGPDEEGREEEARRVA